VIDPRTDPAEKLAELLITLDHTTRRDAAVLRSTEANRFNLLVVHAVAAVVIAPLFILSAPTLYGPNWEFLRLIPFFPYSFGVVFWLGGLILLPATLAKNRRAEMVGLAIVSTWYTILAVGFAIPAVKWFWYWTFKDELLHVRPSFYAWVVYLHLAIIMRVHLWTLWKMGRIENMGRDDSRINTEQGNNDGK
jgi:hypothetical protein